MEKMTIYNAVRSVPKEAQKEFNNGRFKGTDINPMWRIKVLTEQFGPCGLGWYISNVTFEDKVVAGETLTICQLDLFVNYEGTWSQPIHGVGGNRTSTKTASGNTMISDEAEKMAYTDAISVACKALGMAADIYFAKGVQMKDNRTKYDAASEAPATEPERPTNIDPDTYWKVVAAYASGRMTKSGGDFRSRFIEGYHPTPAQVRRFDADVDNYKAANNLK